MRPGSAEILQRYREMAARGEPLRPDPDHTIPHRPGEAEALPRIKQMESNTIDQAIDRLLSDEGEADIVRRITQLEDQRDAINQQLEKLRRLYRSLSGTASDKPARRFKNVDPDIEQRIVKHLERVGNARGIPAGELANCLDITPQKVGITVSASEKLVSENRRVRLASIT